MEDKKANIIILVLAFLALVSLANCLVSIYGTDTIDTANTIDTAEASGYDGLNLSSHPIKDPGYYENNTEVFSTKVGNTDLTVVRGYVSSVKISVPKRSVLAQVSFGNSSENLPNQFTLCRAELWHMTVPRSSGENLMEIVFAEQNEKKVIVNMTILGKDASQDFPVLKVLSKEDKEKLSLY